MQINIKNIPTKLKSLVIIVALGVLFSAGITFAAAVWQGNGLLMVL